MNRYIQLIALVTSLSPLSLKLFASQATTQTLSQGPALSQQENDKGIQALKYFEAALKYRAGEDNADAFRALEHALELDPSNATYQNDLGIYYSKGIGVPKNQTKAVELFQKAAEQKFPAALSNLGSCQEQGLGGLSKDPRKALEYYEMAAKRGYAEAQNNAGLMYGDGKGVERDYAKAVNYYESAAKQNHAPAESNLAYCYEHGFGVQQSFDKAVELYARAAQHGDSQAEETLGDLYKKNGNLQTALDWYQKAYNHGIHRVGNAIALCQRKLAAASTGRLASPFPSPSRSSSRHSVSSVTSPSSLQRAMLSPALSPSPTNARPLVPTSPQAFLFPAALMASPSQPMNFGLPSPLSRSNSAPSVAPVITTSSSSVLAQPLALIPQVPAAARSASSLPPVAPVVVPAELISAPQVAPANEKITADFAQELFEMGRNSYDGSNNTPKDIAVAVLYWEMAAKEGNSNAHYKLGCCYRDGIGTKTDAHAAVQQLTQAADKGLAEAEYDLAALYERGSGVAVNLNKAIDLYIRAANKNHPGAEHKLGLLYEDGISYANRRIEPNITTAISWHKKSGTHGFAEAEVQAALKRCSEKLQKKLSEFALYTMLAQPQPSASSSSSQNTLNASHA